MSDQVGVLEAFHARLTTLKGKVGVALNAVHRHDPARAGILLQELQDLRAHRDWQGAWEQGALEYAIGLVDSAASA